MVYRIIPRSEWGARSWSSTPYSVGLSERRYFVVHYDGGHPIERTGFAIPRTIDNTHHDNGWSGIGYNFVVSQVGEIFEGRGWEYVGAHCPGRNRDGIGVQVAIGGNQAPTAAAKAAVLDLYREANARTGRTLTKGRHGDWYPTDCCGPQLTPWVKDGMLPATETVQLEGDNAPTAIVHSGGFTFATRFPVWAVLSRGQQFWAETIALQYWLNRNGCSLHLDGDFGWKTWDGVRYYQRKTGLYVDGVAGPVTAKRLGLTG